jgi:hypothetical protein
MRLNISCEIEILPVGFPRVLMQCVKVNQQRANEKGRWQRQRPLRTTNNEKAV